jgi:hypothetical protein
MIEMQKSPFQPEVSRFRQYLSEKYHHRTKLSENSEPVDLPIKTIYIIEKVFNAELPAVLYVKGDYYDRLKHTKCNVKRDKFVDLLVHEAYFIQTALLPSDFKDDLVRVLSIFSPRYQIKLGKEDKRFVKINDEELNRYKDHLINMIIKRLNLGGKNNKLLTALEIEINYENEWERTLAQRDKALKLAEEARNREEKALRKAEQERKEKEQARKREEQAKQREAETKAKLIETAKLLKNFATQKN